MSPVQSAVDETVYTLADRMHHAALASMTFGLSPISLTQALQDWLLNLAISPGKQLELLEKLVSKQIRFNEFLARTAVDPSDPALACIQPLKQDHRFDHPGWQHFPFKMMSQAFLLQQQFWHNATTGISGVSARHERQVEFYARQLLDMVSPSNFALTNPEVLEATVASKGANLAKGLADYLEDSRHLLARSNGGITHQPGEDVAITPGKVVLRNELMELIQYSPTTETVVNEPVLIVPAWIMKYYILDLSPENSLIRYLVGQGFTVFAISWINPDDRHRDLSLDDYRALGPMAALEAIGTITGSEKIHAAGYCLGGTLMSITAAAMARDHDDRLASLTLFAAQVDFYEPGELGLFIDDSQLSFLDNAMWMKGYLDQWQMAGAFQMLRSQDLVWSRMVREYLLGLRPDANDMMSWNADATRMPYRMHSDYLRQLYLNNDLSQGRFRAGGKKVTLEDISLPVFAVGTVTDHVAPWTSVFKLTHLFETTVDFVLTSGGHNAGIVSEPGHPHRSFQRLHHREGDPHPDPDTFAATAAKEDGSWWPVWADWLRRHSNGEVAARVAGADASRYPALGDAPGTYVLMR